MGFISHELCSRGLLTHELCLASRCCDILGIELDGGRLRTRAASAKNEKLRLALHRVLEQRRVSGQKLERYFLSAFAAVYKFQQAHHNEPTFLWTSCRAELKHFLNATPLWESNWSLAWSGTVMAADACEDGYGVVSEEFLPSVVSAFGAPFGTSSLRDFSGGCEGRYVVDGSFEEISLPALRWAVWNVHSMEQFLYREATHLQVRGAIRCEEWYGTRCWRSAGLRARSFRLLLLVRRASAAGLACHCRQYFRPKTTTRPEDDQSVKTAGNFKHGKANERARKPRPLPRAKIGDDKDSLSLSLSCASCPWPLRLQSRPSRGRLRTCPCAAKSNK